MMLRLRTVYLDASRFKCQPCFMQGACLLNQAAVHMKRKEFQDAVRCCSECIAVSPANAKARVRKGQAHHALG